MSTENSRNTRLQKLSGSDFEISDGEQDIRGWDVKDASGKQLGEVEDLIFDYETRKVRYLVVDLEENDFDLDDKEVLVPIGIAELHENDDDVILQGVSAEQMRSLPEYDEDRFDTDHETSIRNVFGGLGGAALGAGGMAGSSNNNSDFYNNEQFNDENLYRNRRGKVQTENENVIPVVSEELQVGKKELETGGLRLRSRVVETEVSEDVNLREENVNVERTAVDRLATEADLREDTIEMKEFKEVPVVNKEARVVEEISLSKEVTEREETISDTVRNTEVDIDEDDELRRNTTRNNEL
ncbi:MAG TPA: PRC and DUF2382 domain-containing protein [Flavisolibacter sp.]|jgi:uncharacterized protein (TIGR02271 family)|nr:PRC and DUF2382 domain-containing protein [Flavisolibacter sp.]